MTGNGNVKSIIISPDGLHAAILCGKINTRGYTIFDINNGKWETDHVPTFCAFSRDSKYLIITDRNIIQLFDVEKHTLVKEIENLGSYNDSFEIAGISKGGKIVFAKSEKLFSCLISTPSVPNSIYCKNPVFDTSNPQDINVNIAGSKLKGIKINATSLTNLDYSVSENLVTINKSYLSYYFSKFNMPNQKLNLIFDFENGDDTILTISQIPISNYITCDNPAFELSNPQDLQINISGNRLIAIKNGSAPLNNSDYYISGNVVTIKKNYLIYFFKKFTAPWQKLNLTFDFESGNDPLLMINRAVETNFAECSNPIFDLSNPRDLIVNITGKTLTAIKNGSASLTSSDYSISGNTVTIKKDYLTYFFKKFTDPWQKLNLMFDFEKGNDPLLVVSRGSLFKTIVAGAKHTVALKGDGTVVTSGWYGAPDGLVGVKSIASGTYHIIALKEDGTVVAWGDNFYGQCNVPNGLNGVRAVAGGLGHTLALKEDGTVVAWGYDDYDQCRVPKELSKVKAIAAGADYSAALKEDGTVVFWGDNSERFTAFTQLTGIKAIAAKDLGMVVLKEDGTVFDGSETPKGLSGVKAIAAGSYHTVALKEDGTVVAWGSNYKGQCNVPAGLTGVKAIAAGDFYTVALKEDGTTVGWGDNPYVPKVK